uniref:type IX secretion system membrane protein PorP/SprF n=1 Tax=Flavobacterium sp. TaxID=239 RepID=UPI00404737C5
MEVGYGSKSFGFQNLILRDQINIDTEIINPTSIDPLQLNNRIHFIDISTGLLFYTENIWIGTAIKHLNKPNIAIAEEGNIPFRHVLQYFYRL